MGPACVSIFSEGFVDLFFFLVGFYISHSVVGLLTFFSLLFSFFLFFNDLYLWKRPGQLSCRMPLISCLLGVMVSLN